MSNRTTAAAIVVVIDLYKTDAYRLDHRRREESGNGKNTCGVVRYVLSGGR